MLPNRKTETPNKINPQIHQYPLSRITPKSATVGWMKPAYDHLPKNNYLLMGGGELFDTGIYAHAEARHVYDLSNSKWKRLKGDETRL